MVVNRSDVKKRRKEGDGMDGTVDGSPRRTKVHAQRKFAQGSSSISSVALTPVKDKDKLKTNGTVVSPELMPLKRPKTEDFLTFLCFRGSSLLPPQLNFFNVATFQDTQDEESFVSARDRSPNSSIDFTSVGQNLQKVLEMDQSSEFLKIDEKKHSDATKRRATAVQAIRRKYQGQRLAKQRANTLNKSTRKVNGKAMVLTRSSAMRTESGLGFGILKPNNSAIQKCPEKDVKILKALEPLKFVPLRRRSILGRRKFQDLEYPTERRCGLRSSALLPLRIGKAVENRVNISGVPSKQSLSETKTFVSSLSDFSSDDDKPLAKTKSNPQLNQKVLAGKVMKRIANRSGQIETHMITRSRVQHQHRNLDEQHCQQQKWSLHEVGFHQQHHDQHVLHHRFHYLYRQRRAENGHTKQPVHVQLNRLLPLTAHHQKVPSQTATRYLQFLRR